VCHAAKFRSFSQDHPEFTAFPAGRATSDYFEHGVHEKEMKGLRCGDCHTPDANGSRILVGTYRAMCADCHEEEMRNLTPVFAGAPAPPLGRLTRFDHGPHLNQPCVGCHRTAPAANFGPVTKAMCTDCHTAGKAGTTCLTCHQYHDRRFALTPAR
jgi:predicted CXXCH cytochrome family protein